MLCRESVRKCDGAWRVYILGTSSIDHAGDANEHLPASMCSQAP